MSRHDRIYIDGCLDMMHHGHSGAIRQAKMMGRYLVCGVHNDEEIALNKGIPVMNADERYTAAAACKWVDEIAEGAPYVMDLKFLDEKSCDFVVHGDDITTDANGVDCYQEVKDKGRFLVCKRTPAISTTDLVGRMLLHTRDHHYWSTSEEPYSSANVELYAKYATGTDAVSPQAPVFRHRTGTVSTLVEGIGPTSGQDVVYADGGWDLFTPGHVEMLKSVKKNGQYLIVGVHDDQTINTHKGLNYPIMNLKERALTLLACRVRRTCQYTRPFSDAVVCRCRRARRSIRDHKILPLQPALLCFSSVPWSTTSAVLRSWVRRRARYSQDCGSSQIRRSKCTNDSQENHR